MELSATRLDQEETSERLEAAEPLPDSHSLLVHWSLGGPLLDL